MRLDNGKTDMTTLIYPERAPSGIAMQELDFKDIDQQAACLTGYDQKYQQMSCGHYQGWFRTILLGDDLGLFFETFNQSLEQWGASPSDRYGFIFFMDPSNRAMLGNHELCGNQILFLPPGHSFDFQAPPHTRFCVVSIDRLVFGAALQHNIASDRQRNVIKQSTLILKNPDTLMLLRQLISYAITQITGQKPVAYSANTITGVKRSLVELLAGFVADHKVNAQNSPKIAVRPSAFLAGQIREFIRAQNSSDIIPEAIAQEFRISRRHLEHLFRTHFNQSPARYIRTVKLNEFRSALIQSANLNHSIGDIAAQFGFWHLSRLGEHYRRQFGELPSATRMRLRKS